MAKDYMLTYRRVENLQLVGFLDSEFAGDKDELKSTSGFIFMMTGGEVSWLSKKHKLIVYSTMQVEFVACYGAAIQALWLRNLMSDLIVVDFVSRPIWLYCDNSSAVDLINSNKSITGAKHMEIKYLTVKEKAKIQWSIFLQMI